MLEPSRALITNIEAVVDPLNVSTPPDSSFSMSCTGQACVFQGPVMLEDSPVVNWDWSWGDGSSLSRSFPLAKKIFAAAGVYAITLTVTSASGATWVATRVDTVGVESVQTDTSSFEPAGMTRITENKFDCLKECANRWYVDVGHDSGAVVIARESDAPAKDSTVVQQNFFPWLAGGTSPGVIGTSLPGPRTLYVSFLMRLSSNFQGHPTGVNKVLHFWTKGGRNPAVFSIRGKDDGQLTAGFSAQGLALPYAFSGDATALGGDLDPNRATCVVNRGQWHRYEVVLTDNIAGYPDGRVEYWLDGVKCADYTGVGFVASGQNDKWEELQWSPTWGGTGGRINAPFFMQMDDIYVSGKK